MSELERIIRDIVASSPEAEEVLDRAGIDYWFGWNRPLGAVCAASEIDQTNLVDELNRLPRRSVPLETKELPQLLRAAETHWTTVLEPALRAVAELAAASSNEHAAKIATLLHQLDRDLRHEVDAYREVAKLRQPSIDFTTLRSLRLLQLDLERVARELRRTAAALPSDPASGELADQVRRLVREVHRRMRIDFNATIPALAEVAHAKFECEPW